MLQAAHALSTAPEHEATRYCPAGHEVLQGEQTVSAYAEHGVDAYHPAGQTVQPIQNRSRPP